MRLACRHRRCARIAALVRERAWLALVVAMALPAHSLESDSAQHDGAARAGVAMESDAGAAEIAEGSESGLAGIAMESAAGPAAMAPVPEPAPALDPRVAEQADPDALEVPSADDSASAEDEARLLEEALLEEGLFEEESEFESEAARRDPFEGLNRGVFRFNRGLDYVLLDPITKGYQWVVPRPGRRAVHRFFLNLDTPVVLANQVLQVRPVDAAGTVARFVLNSTAGVAGFLDPGAAAGIPRTEADFGQTLARYGAPSGPYLVLPVFGPSTVRDGLGSVVDVIVDPVTYLLGPFQWWTLVLGGGEGLVVREATIADLEALEAGSIDFYSALRSAYLQSRDAAVREVRDEGDATLDVVMSFGAAALPGAATVGP